METCTLKENNTKTEGSKCPSEGEATMEHGFNKKTQAKTAQTNKT